MGPNRQQNPGPARAAASIKPHVVMALSSAVTLVHTWPRCVVIGSGAHVTMVAVVSNASGIGKAFIK